MVVCIEGVSDDLNEGYIHALYTESYTNSNTFVPALNDKGFFYAWNNIYTCVAHLVQAHE